MLNILHDPTDGKKPHSYRKCARKDYLKYVRCRKHTAKMTRKAIHILNMGLVENTLTGNLILTVMLAFAEYERGTIVERTQTGKAIARQDPNFKDGRPKKFTQEQIELALSLLEQGKTYRQITQMTGISKSTVIRNRQSVRYNQKRIG